MLAQVGKPAPIFTLASTKDATRAKELGKPISLSDYRGKWLIFFFYPLDFTFVCPTEITALSDRYDEVARPRCGRARRVDRLGALALRVAQHAA